MRTLGFSTNKSSFPAKFKAPLNRACADKL
jgi:hypothetical protein